MSKNFKCYFKIIIFLNLKLAFCQSKLYMKLNENWFYSFYNFFFSDYSFGYFYFDKETKKNWAKNLQIRARQEMRLTGNVSICI